MAKAYLRTCAGAINAAHSPISIFLFARFLSSLPELIAAERDMIGLSGQDPALDRWFTDAEVARAVTLARLTALSTVTSGTVLKAVGELFERMMVSDYPEDCVEMRSRAANGRQEFLLRSEDRMSQAINQMIHLALDQFEIYCALDDDFIDGDAFILDEGMSASCADQGLTSAA